MTCVGAGTTTGAAGTTATGGVVVVVVVVSVDCANATPPINASAVVAASKVFVIILFSQRIPAAYARPVCRQCVDPCRAHATDRSQTSGQKISSRNVRGVLQTSDYHTAIKRD